jgi:hypothetical protein
VGSGFELICFPFIDLVYRHREGFDRQFAGMPSYPLERTISVVNGP